MITYADSPVADKQHFINYIFNNFLKKIRYMEAKMSNPSNYENIAENLMKSYGKDEEPFTRDTGLAFPERSIGFGELEILRKLLFPNF